MVAPLAVVLDGLLAPALLAEELPPTTKAVALMALLGILLVGLLLVVFILLGGHWVRRIGSHRRGPSVPPDLVLRREQPGQEPRPVDSDLPPDETFVDDQTSDTRNC